MYLLQKFIMYLTSPPPPLWTDMVFSGTRSPLRCSHVLWMYPYRIQQKTSLFYGKRIGFPSWCYKPIFSEGGPVIVPVLFQTLNTIRLIPFDMACCQIKFGCQSCLNLAWYGLERYVKLGHAGTSPDKS